MFAATGETEASSSAGDGRNAARGGGTHPHSTARVPGARRSLSVRRDQFGDQIKASLNRGLVASTRQLALDVLGCIILPGPAAAVRLAASPVSPAGKLASESFGHITTAAKSESLLLLPQPSRPSRGSGLYAQYANYCVYA